MFGSHASTEQLIISVLHICVKAPHLKMQPLKICYYLARAVYQKNAFDIRKSLSVDCINVSHYDGATINCQQLHYCYYSCDPRNFATMTFFSG